MNTYTYERQTTETQFKVTLNLKSDVGETGETGEASEATFIKTGIGFFDHLLTLMAFHGGFNLKIVGQGDLEVDTHHTIEDIGISLGNVFRQLAVDRQRENALPRYSEVTLPMDESLIRVVLDVSGRGGAYTTLPFTVERIGTLETEMIHEFLLAFAHTARITLHADVLKGRNNHHMAEALFKGLGRSIKMAYGIASTGINGLGTSTKGTLELEEQQ